MEGTMQKSPLFFFLIMVVLFPMDRIDAGGTDAEVKKAGDTLSIPGSKAIDESKTLIQSLEGEYCSLVIN